MSYSEKLAQTTAVIAIALVAAVWLVLPSSDLSFLVFGSSVDTSVSSVWQFGMLAIAIGLVGTHSVVSSDVTGLATAATYWALPTAIVAIGVFGIDTIGRAPAGTMLAGFTSAAFAVVIHLQTLTRGLRQDKQQIVRQLLTLLTFGLAGLLFFAVARYDFGIVPRVLGVCIVAGGLATEVFRDTDVSTRDIWFHSGLTGLVLAELEMGMVFVAMPARMMAGILFLAFYVVTGLSQQSLWGRLSGRVLAEYGLLSTVGLLFLYFVLR